MTAPESAAPLEGALSAALLDTIFTGAPIGLAFVDRDLRFVRINERLAEINGLPAAAHVGRGLHEILPQLAPSLEPIYHRVLDTGEPVVGIEISGETAAAPGTPRSWVASYLPVVDNGRALGVLAVIEETTAVRGAEQTAIHFLEHMDDAFVAFDRDLHYTYVNAKAGELFGRSPESLLGKLYLEEYPEAEGTPFHRAYERALETGKLVAFEDHYEPWDRWFENRAHPSADGLTVFFTEITERKRVELALREANELLAAIVRSSPVAVGTVAPDGTLTSWSPAGERMLGWSEAELVGKGPVIVPGDLLDEARDLYRRAAAGETVADIETKRLHKDGSLVDVSLSLAPLRDEQGAVAGIIGVLADITERRRAEAELLTSTETLRLAAAGARMGVWEVDLADGIALSDAVAMEITGMQRRSTQEEFLDRVEPGDRQAVAVSLEAALQGEAPYSLEFRVRSRDGPKWVSAAGVVLRSELGEPERMVGVVFDITARKEREEAIRASQERLQLAADAAEMGIWEMDVARNLGRGDSRVAHLLGIDLPAPLDEIFERVHPADRERVRSALDQAIASGTPFAVEHRTVTAAAEEKWVQSSASLVRDERGAPQRLIGVVFDITARKLREEQLRQALERERLATRTAGMGVWDVDLGTLEVTADPVVEAVFGLEPGSFGGTAAEVFELIHEDDRDLVRRAQTATITSGSPYDIEYRIVTPAGDVRWVHSVATILRDETGQARRMLGVLSDVTERRHTERELRALTEELEARVVERTAQAAAARAEAERANAAKSEFLSQMSHELRTPLNAILGFGQLLEDDELSADQHEAVERIIVAGRHLLGLVDELLDVPKIEAGALELQLEPVLLADVLHASLNLLRPLALERNIVLAPCPEAATSLWVLADHQRLLQVVLNLLANAVKYNRTGGRVDLVCSGSPPGRGRLEVRDSGTGIAEEDLSRIFLPFERVESGAHEEGTGLGLSVAKALVEAMDGSIGAVSTQGEGSVFFVELPLAEPGPAAEAPADSTEPAALAEPRTILLIEDDPSSIELVRRVIADVPGSRLVVATSGGEGLEAARAAEPSVVLLDLGLPDGPGDEILHRLRQHPETAKTSVVVISADARDETIARLLAAGAVDFVSKPIDIARLRTLLTR